MRNLRFKLGDKVVIKLSGAIGEVIGRAEYEHSESNYLLRLVNKQGNLEREWFNDSDIEGIAQE